MEKSLKDKRRKMAVKIVESPVAYRPQPTLRLCDDDLPAIKKWDVGKKYNVHATVEMTRLSKGDEYMENKGKKPYEASFKVVSIKSI